MAAYTGVTALSSTGVSPTLTLDPTSKTTTLILTSSGGTADITVQGSVWTPGSAGTAQWAAVSSHIASSAASPDGVYLSLLTPIAGLRLSSSAVASGTVTLQALQAIQS